MSKTKASHEWAQIYCGYRWQHFQEYPPIFTTVSFFVVWVFHIFFSSQVYEADFVRVHHDQDDSYLRVFFRCWRNTLCAKESLVGEPKTTITIFYFKRWVDSIDILFLRLEKGWFFVTCGYDEFRSGYWICSWWFKYAISELSLASFSKQVLMLILSYEN